MVLRSTTDIVNALVAKGVLTEEEGALLNKGREGEAAGQAKALKKASKLSVSDAVDNAQVYGDIRVRYEDREGDGLAGGVASAAAGSPSVAINTGSASITSATDLNGVTGQTIAPGAAYIKAGAGSSAAVAAKM